MRRLALPVVVIAALTLATTAALRAPVPHPLPVIALGAVAVWRAEVAALLFAAFYGAIVALRLAFHGETLTRVGRDGIEIPRVGAARDDAEVLEWIRASGRDRGASAPDHRHPLLRDDEWEA